MLTTEASLWAAVFSWLGVRDGRVLSPLRFNEFPYIYLHPFSNGKIEECFLLTIAPNVGLWYKDQHPMVLMESGWQSPYMLGFLYKYNLCTSPIASEYLPITHSTNCSVSAVWTVVRQCYLGIMTRPKAYNVQC